MEYDEKKVHRIQVAQRFCNFLMWALLIVFMFLSLMMDMKSFVPICFLAAMGLCLIVLGMLEYGLFRAHYKGQNGLTVREVLPMSIELLAGTIVLVLAGNWMSLLLNQ